jgi:branched-chain amino acid transport system substrate-binding protein
MRGIELAKSLDSEAVANALRANPVYDHYKGKQWWRPCDNKSFQDQLIVKPRDPAKNEGEWGLFEIISTVPADESVERTCAEKGWA